MGSRIVVTVFMPGLMGFGVCFFLSGHGPAMWVLASPLLLLVLFMATLAEVHELGDRFLVKTSFQTRYVLKEDILSIGNSILEDVGMIRPKRYIFPWGAVYFIREWSAQAHRGKSPRKSSRN